MKEMGIVSEDTEITDEMLMVDDLGLTEDDEALFITALEDVHGLELSGVEYDRTVVTVQDVAVCT